MKFLTSNLDYLATALALIVLAVMERVTAAWPPI